MSVLKCACSAEKDKNYGLAIACVFRKHGASAGRWQWTIDGEDRRAKANATILENGILWCDELCFTTSFNDDEKTIDLSNVNNLEALEIWLDLHDGKSKKQKK